MSHTPRKENGATVITHDAANLRKGYSLEVAHSDKPDQTVTLRIVHEEEGVKAEQVLSASDLLAIVNPRGIVSPRTAQEAAEDGAGYLEEGEWSEADQAYENEGDVGIFKDPDGQRFALL